MKQGRISHFIIRIAVLIILFQSPLGYSIEVLEDTIPISTNSVLERRPSVAQSAVQIAALPLNPQSLTLPPCKKQLSSETCAKIGQMIIVGFGGLNQDAKGKILWQDLNGTVFNKNSNIAKEIKNLHIGGVILFTRPFRHNETSAFIRERNIQNPKQTAKLTEDLQNYSKQTRTEAGLMDLPLLISIDQEGGVIDRLPKDLGFSQSTILPQALGANEERVLVAEKISNNPSVKQGSSDIKASDSKKSDIKKEKALKQTRKYADQMAAQLQQEHFNLNFAPCVDININPLNLVLGARGRCFSANPDIVVDQAWQFVQAFHDKRIIATLKHFPGHGSSSEDSHDGLVDVTETYQKEQELLPYQRLIQKGFQDIIMTAHVINGNIDKTQCKKGAASDPKTWCPGTLSYNTLTKLLRKQLGFKGVIVSDDMTMGAMANEYPLEIALEKAINAGVDMFIVANNTADDTEHVINTMAKLVKEGKVREQQIDDAYNRIVQLKKRTIDNL